MDPNVTALVSALSQLISRMDQDQKNKTTPNDIERKKAGLADVAALIGKFHFVAEDESTSFESWFRSNKGLFEKHCESDEDRSTVLLKALGIAEYKQIRGRSSPKDPETLKFSELIEMCKDTFACTKSDFRRRYETLMLKVPNDIKTEDLFNEANLKGDLFKFDELSIDLFKIFLILIWTNDKSFKNLRSLILKAVDEDPLVTLNKLRKKVACYETRVDDALLQNSSEEFLSQTSQVFALHNDKVNPRSSNQKGKQRRFNQSCFRCGSTDHYTYAKCPVKEETCNFCKRVGHIAKVCRSKQKMQIGFIALNSVDMEFPRSRTYCDINILGKNICFQADTGADLTTIGTKLWEVIGKPKLINFTKDCNGIGQQKINPIGYFMADLSYNNQSTKAPVLVIPISDCALLGNQPLKDLSIVTWNIESKSTESLLHSNVNCFPVSTSSSASSLTSTLPASLEEIKLKFPTLFGDGIGSCNVKRIHLYLLPEARPVHVRSRQVALAVQPLIERELDRLLQNGTIEKVENSPWATPIVVVRKPNGTIRMCADYSTGLNSVLQSDFYPIPNIEAMLTKFTGKRIFSKIDLSDAYHQLLLDDDSKQLTTISTHRGLFQFCRLPFGIKTASSIFQRTMDELLADIDGTYAYQNDIVIMGKDKSSHDKSLNQVLIKLQKWGFKLRLNKCQFYVPQINYLGRIVTEKGIDVNRQHVEAINQLKKPSNQTEIRSLLGMINYYSQFVKQLHIYRRPFEKLLKKNQKFKWAKEQDEAFKKIKELLKSPLLLDHFDPKQQLIVAADACNTGIGGVLLQRYQDGNEKPWSRIHAYFGETKKRRNVSTPTEPSARTPRPIRSTRKLVNYREAVGYRVNRRSLKKGEMLCLTT